MFKKMLHRIREWLKWLFHDEYILEVYFAQEVILDPSSSLKVVRRERAEYHVKRIIKCSTTHIIAKDHNGRRLEIKSIEPFGYTIKKVY